MPSNLQEDEVKDDAERLCSHVHGYLGKMEEIGCIDPYIVATRCVDGKRITVVRYTIRHPGSESPQQVRTKLVYLTYEMGCGIGPSEQVNYASWSLHEFEAAYEVAFYR